MALTLGQEDDYLNISVKKLLQCVPSSLSDCNESLCTSKSIALKHVDGSDSKHMQLRQHVMVSATSY